MDLFWFCELSFPNFKVLLPQVCCNETYLSLRKFSFPRYCASPNMLNGSFFDFENLKVLLKLPSMQNGSSLSLGNFLSPNSKVCSMDLLWVWKTFLFQTQSIASSSMLNRTFSSLRYFPCPNSRYCFSKYTKRKLLWV